MTTLSEGSLKFRFPDNCLASKYDCWAFYRKQFQSVAKGSKAVDIVCVEKDVCWLVEIKDYRKHPRSRASLLGKLKRKNLKAVDAHPVICDRSTPPRGAPWTVE